MNLPTNLGKSTILATSIFWIIILTDEPNFNLFPFMFLSMIPIFICCTITITVTICPIFWLCKNKHFNKKKIFKTCFPVYAIIAFGICAYGIYNADNEVFFISFFISAYITTAQSWVWFAKENNTLKTLSNEHTQN